MAIVFLIDRSPSVTAPERHGPSLDKLAEDTLDEIGGLAAQQKLPLFFSSANFGRNISDSHSLEPIRLVSSSLIPRREVIPYTDFRVAIKYALEQINRGESIYGTHKALVVLFTDAEPWPPGGILTQAEKEAYFRGIGRFSLPNQPSLSDSIRKVRNSGGEVVLLAVNDDPDDAKLWRADGEGTKYISLRESSRFFPELRRLLAAAIQEHKEAALPLNPPIDSTKLTPKTQHSSAPAPLAWLVISALITIGPLAALLLRQRAQLAKQRTLTSSQSQLIETQRRLIDDLKAQNDEEMKTLQELEAHARTIARENKEQAIPIYKDLLNRKAELLTRRDLAASRGFAGTVSEMLSCCGGSLQKEHLLIRELLAMGQRREVANGLAPVLLKRWVNNKEILLDEFYLLRMEPLGIYVLEGLTKIDGAGEGLGDTGLESTIRQLAQAARELYQVAG